MKEDKFMRSYSIREVSKELKVSVSTIRDWEKYLADILVIPRNERGDRYYTEFEIYTLTNIRKLRQSGASIKLIKEVMKRPNSKNAEELKAPMVIPVAHMSQNEAVQTLSEIREQLTLIQSEISLLRNQLCNVTQKKKPFWRIF
jgi:DNA-binding transcriptional MerR regulator